MTLYATTLDTPIGPLRVIGDGHALHAINLPELKVAPRDHDDVIDDARPLEPILRQLDEFFAGDRKEFDLVLAPRGTPFQQRVWEALRAIPFGETATYGEIAAAIGQPTAVRAVGAANARNPIPIVVPCHRVIGANGTLTGYAGGLSTKQQLLELERKVAAG
jgi:methylated-DNA-[protein]-cysteine S-methyltransferase